MTADVPVLRHGPPPDTGHRSGRPAREVTEDLPAHQGDPPGSNADATALHHDPTPQSGRQSGPEASRSNADIAVLHQEPTPRADRQPNPVPDKANAALRHHDPRSGRQSDPAANADATARPDIPAATGEGRAPVLHDEPAPRAGLHPSGAVRVADVVVARGDPTPEELAAVLVAAALLDAGAESPGRPARTAWRRQPDNRGPGAWRRGPVPS
ncbi:acyl-CoA carboxylase epsilon subunit [Actinosynnema sp. NPDC020468]|uniref:acyl-CoA carboxylase epsilon subunit n=1 Tax=Actinosynnema sp. NPDC020468 TaxID=3154488 RepID=UPI003410BAB7